MIREQTQDPAFVVHYNGRNDNLGDQVIFGNLVDLLSSHGRVFLKDGGSAPAGSGAPLIPGIEAMCGLSFGGIYYVGPPGAHLWNSGKRSFPGNGAAFSIGNSVIPGSPHHWVKAFDWVGVRDLDSLNELKHRGYAHVSYFPDLALLGACDFPDGGSQGRVALSFRDRIPERRYTGAGGSFLKAVAETMGCLRETFSGRDLLTYHQVDEDHGGMRRLSEACGVPNKPSRLAIPDYHLFYRENSFVISNRLHCLLLGAMNGVVPIALTTSDHTKLVSFYRTMGWEALLIELDRCRDVRARLEEIKQSTPLLQELVKRVIVEHRNIGLEALKLRCGL